MKSTATPPAPRRPGPARAARKVDFRNLFEAGLIDPRSSTPLFLQVCLAIREKILSSTLSNGDLLPSESTIIELFGVSRITARRAIHELVNMGLAVSQKGRGTLVSFQGTKQRQRGAIEDLLENLLVLGETTRVELISFEYVDASPQAAAALQLEAGSKVQHALRLRHEDAHPLGLLETYVPGELGRKFTRAELEHIPLQTLLARAGVTVARAEQSLSAYSATGSAARLLQVETGAPLFRIVRTVFDGQGVPVEFVTALYRSDRYVYHMSLTQSKGQWKRE